VNNREKVLTIIKLLKKEYMGTPLTALRFSTPFELLVATILSAQTTDVQVNKVTPGLFFQWDKTEIDRPKSILSPLANFQWNIDPKTQMEFDLVGQVGKYVHGGVANHDVDFLAGAVQVGAQFDLRPVVLHYNLLAFSADDGDKNDSLDTGFHYSGWSKSSLMILARNWLHDQYDNIDERAAAQEAGLFLADQALSVYLHESFRLIAIVGVGTTLDNTNTGGSYYLGTEGHIGAEFAPYQEHASFVLLAGGILPGKAGGMLKNEIDRKATDPLGELQASMILKF